MLLKIWQRVLLFILFTVAVLPASSYASLDAIANASKSVVAVSVRGEDGNDLLAGSGFIISEGGLVVTSSYLAGRSSSQASNLTIHTVNSGPIVVEKIIMSDKDLGLAVLRVRVIGLPPVKLDPEYRLKKGDPYYVVGNPRSKTPLVLDGTVKTEPGSGLLELGMKVPRENDGGPVLNTKGAVIGIVVNRRESGRILSQVVPVKRLSEMLDPHKNKLLSQAWFELGIVYDAEPGRADDSIAAYSESVRLDSNYPEAYNNLGAACGRAGRYRDAIEALNKAIRIKPDYTEANFNLGVAYSKTGQFQESVDLLIKHLQARPGDAEALNRLGLVYVRMGRYQDAVDASARAAKARPDFKEAYNNLGAAYGSMGRNQEAVDAFRQAIKIWPDYADARYLLAVIYLSMDNAESARNEYNKLKQLDKVLAEKLSKLLNSRGQ
jgi:Flp pilus assembly protein TadD